MTLIQDLPLKIAADTDVFIIDQLGSDGKVTRADIVSGVAADIAAESLTRSSEIATLTSSKLNLSGGTMTGALILSGAPISGLAATNKDYVDTLVGSKASITSPVFLGLPTTPTALITTNTDQIASTKFVHDLLEGTIYNKTNIVTGTHLLTESETGYINVNFNGIVNITLPEISTLVNPAKVKYIIKDISFQANTTTRAISVIRSGSDIIENGLVNTKITTGGETLIFTNDGVSNWYIEGVDTLATGDNPGIVQLANTTPVDKVIDLDFSTAISPGALNEILNEFVYKNSQVGAATKALTESDRGTSYVTYTSIGSVAITVPSVASLNDPTKVMYEIVDAADNADVNNITISAISGNIDGQPSVSISAKGASLIIYNDGSEWRTKSNTQKAVTEAVNLAILGASPLTTKGDLYTFSTLDTKLSVGPDGYVLTADSIEATGLKWSPKGLPLAGTLLLGNTTGGTDILVSTGDKIDLDGNVIQMSNIAGDIVSLYTISNDLIISSSAGLVNITADGGLQVSNGIRLNGADIAWLGSLTNNALIALGDETNSIRWGTAGNVGDLTSEPLSSPKSWVLPNQSGTIALKGDSNNLTTIELPIGDWNMDSTAVVSVNHGLSITEWKTIRSINVIIRNDADDTYHNLVSMDDVTGGLLSGAIDFFDDTSIDLMRHTAGKFDNISYDSTSYNRGWITIQYTKD